MENASDVFNAGTSKSKSKAMVVLPKISYTSTCPHHKNLVTGKCAFAYVPNGVLAGIGRIPKLVRLLAEGETLQEELTEEIASQFQKLIKPKGVVVMLEARHECMLKNVLKTDENKVITLAFTGEFRKHERQKQFFAALKQ